MLAILIGFAKLGRQMPLRCSERSPPPFAARQRFRLQFLLNGIGAALSERSYYGYREGTPLRF